MACAIPADDKVSTWCIAFVTLLPIVSAVRWTTLVHDNSDDLGHDATINQSQPGDSHCWSCGTPNQMATEKTAFDVLPACRDTEGWETSDARRDIASQQAPRVP